MAKQKVTILFPTERSGALEAEIGNADISVKGVLSKVQIKAKDLAGLTITVNGNPVSLDDLVKGGDFIVGTKEVQNN